MYNDITHILERLDQDKLWSFPGGVHPDGRKHLSNQTDIATAELPPEVIIPIRQHIGTAGNSIVKVGDNVLKGQALTCSPHPFSVPVHAPTSGEIIAIEERTTAHPSGLPELCVVIKPDGMDTWTELHPLANYVEQEKKVLVNAICDAGIAGMGGAGFPTHIKSTARKPVEFLIINGVECEPYITADDRLMREHAWQIRQGIEILQYLISPKVIIVAIEDNKPEAFNAMQHVCKDVAAIRVIQIPTKYPAGGEKQLIQVVTGREVPRDGLPADVGVMMFNVGTCFAIADAILHGKPLIQRVVTLTGEALQKPQNVWALIGTPVQHLLSQAQYQANKQKQPTVIMGGPMMGFTLSSVNVPVVKTTNCLLVPAKNELRQGQRELACIRCSACADACPVSLLPQQMYWHSKAGELDKAAEYNLFDCIECGACAFVCPSEIPLVHYYRKAKSQIRIQRDEKDKAEKSRQRFEARKARLEKEKAERETKHKQAAAARKQAQQSASEDAPKDKVAAALARAKAKKAAQMATETPVSETASEATDNKAKVAAALARAKAKRQQQSEQTDTTVQAEEKQSAATDDKKAKVAAAIARAKAKKAAQSNAETQANNDVDEPEKVIQQTEEPASADTKEAERQAKIAAAVARAKAKKAEQRTDSENEENSSQPSSDSTAQEEPEGKEAARKAKIAAAVARAKAKKAAQESDKVEDNAPDSSTKAAIQNEAESSAPETAQVEDKEAERKAKIAAAVARAKAKKAAKDANDTNEGDK